MKRIVAWAVLTLLVTVTASGQVRDAFGGILPVTDAKMKMSLNGQWQLKVVDGITDDRTVPPTDQTWRTIPVPGCWEAYGCCKPSYDKAQPMTGYYRTAFSVPEAWKGQRVVIRFDGVLYGYDLWVNGHCAGSWRSGYNTALFDLTPYLTRQPRQELALRVITRFPGSDFDYNDDWAPSGIFRDVTLMAVPKTHLADLTIRTKNSGLVDVTTDVAYGDKSTEVCHDVLDATGRLVATTRAQHATTAAATVTATAKVEAPHLWTAETPYLYTLRTTLLRKGKTLQQFEHRFGFRELTVDGNVLKVNGRPVKLRGVTAHSTDPVTVKVISEASIRRDMKLMKEASINYIRTSHYPREPRFYELADSLGFYVVDEVPFGFGDKLLSDTAYYPVLQQRAQATIRRDKNHPSVIIWSLGNENPLTDICVRLGEYVKTELDPSRPYCYPQVGSYFRRFFSRTALPLTKDGQNGAPHPFPSAAPIYAPHYPTTGQIGGFYQLLDRPVIFTEYCHTLGISLEDHDRQWEIIERTPGIAGGSVWEWADQGMPFHNGESTLNSKLKFGYEERVFTSEDGGFEMFGNKGTDGLLYADRTPLPNYYELQRNYARAFVETDSGKWKISNRYDFLNLKDNVTFHWVLTADRDTVAQGAFSPDCQPRSTTDYDLQLPVTRPTALSLLDFTATDSQGHTFLRQSFVLNKPRQEWTGNGSPEDLIRQTLVRTGRKPTMGERLTQKGRLPERYLLRTDNSQVRADISRQSTTDGGQEVTFTLTPDTADLFRAELGLAYLLDPAIDRVQWIGYGPMASYPARQRANRYGFWAKHMGDLYFEGNHSGIDAALLTDKDGNGLLLTGDSLSLNFEQTDRGLVVTVNAAVSGQGPKFAKTHFPGWQRGDAPVSARFQCRRIVAGQWPTAVARLFRPAQCVPAPLRPFVTQYDTYLMRFADIAE